MNLKMLEPILRPDGNSGIINQMYIYWNVKDNLTITLGNFNTFSGYEVISPLDNFNYSTSYLFSYGPFSHSGLKVEYGFGSSFSAMVGVFNPTDATEYNPNDNYVGGFQLGYDKDLLGAYLNLIVSENFYLLDLTLGYDISESIHLGVNTAIAKENFYGAAGYLQMAVENNLSVGTRLEYFVDKGVGALGLDESVFDISLSANYTIGNLVLIPELRYDFSSSDLVLAGGTNQKKTLGAFVLAAVYGF